MKKAVFIDAKFYYKLQKVKKNLNLTVEPQLLHCRKTQLLPCSIGFTFIVHNGKNYLKVYVSEKIIGHKVGEFSGSRRRYFFKKGKVAKIKKK